jgi:hypothetical protein
MLLRFGSFDISQDFFYSLLRKKSYDDQGVPRQIFFCVSLLWAVYLIFSSCTGILLDTDADPFSAGFDAPSGEVPLEAAQGGEHQAGAAAAQQDQSRRGQLHHCSEELARQGSPYRAPPSCDTVKIQDGGGCSQGSDGHTTVRLK